MLSKVSKCATVASWIRTGLFLALRRIFFNRQEGTKSGHKQLLNHKLLVPYRMENFHVNPTNTKVIKSLSDYKCMDKDNFVQKSQNITYPCLLIVTKNTVDNALSPVQM